MDNATPASGLIAQRLRHAREQKGLTQIELSGKLGFKDRQTLAAIEAGERALSAEELIEAVRVLGVDLDYFTDSFRLAGEGRFTWRASTAHPRKLNEFEEQAGRWISTYRRLGERHTTGRTLEPRLGLMVENSYEQAEAAGEALGREWKLGDVPALKLEAAIAEHLHALILWVDAPMEVSGAAFRMPGLSAILINRHETAGRRHFDLAHECFHLLTWEQMQPEHTEVVEASTAGKGRQKRIEQLANAFAGALLMPQRILQRYWDDRGRRDIHTWLNDTATKLQVTARALKWRIVQLKWIERSKLSEIADAKLTSNGQRGRAELPKPFNYEFVARLHQGIESGAVSVRRAASLVGITIDGLADLFTTHGIAVPFEA